jgi:hypothetical protein
MQVAKFLLPKLSTFNMFLLFWPAFWSCKFIHERHGGPAGAKAPSNTGAYALWFMSAE